VDIVWVEAEEFDTESMEFFGIINWLDQRFLVGRRVIFGVTYN
jgi:hypothetical protein